MKKKHVAHRCAALGCATLTLSHRLCLKHRHINAKAQADVVLRKLAASATVH